MEAETKNKLLEFLAKEIKVSDYRLSDDYLILTNPKRFTLHYSFFEGLRKITEIKFVVAGHEGINYMVVVFNMSGILPSYPELKLLNSDKILTDKIKQEVKRQLQRKELINTY